MPTTTYAFTRRHKKGPFDLKPMENNSSGIILGDESPELLAGTLHGLFKNGFGPCGSALGFLLELLGPVSGVFEPMGRI